MRATRTAGMVVRGHGPLLPGNTCVETARHGTARQTIERFGMWVFTVSAPSSGKSPGAISRMQVAGAQGCAAALASGEDPHPEARVLQS